MIVEILIPVAVTAVCSIAGTLMIRQGAVDAANRRAADAERRAAIAEAQAARYGRTLDVFSDFWSREDRPASPPATTVTGHDAPAA